MLIKIFPANINMKLVSQVVETLNNDGVIIIPTDTVYALACSIKSARAFERICRIKDVKPAKAQFSFACYDLSDISEYTKPFSREVFRLMKNPLPGPFTFILNASSMVPVIFRSNKKTIGIRVPDNNITRTIIKELGNPLMVTSIHNEDEIIDYVSNPDTLDEKFSDTVDLVIDGGYSELEPSTIIDCIGEVPVVVREGKGKLSD
jgi:tRNA threonylcarbamoyl adenosine modification protein (Sua5/YciO/YrdC/YwlC family)